MWQNITGIFTTGTIQLLQGGTVQADAFNYFFTLCFVCSILPLPFTWIGSIIRESWAKH